MTGLFGSLNTATSGMRAQQAALQTTSHNLANSNTVGYSRQRVTLEANVPQSHAGVGQIGTGVLLNGITRVTDDFVTMQLQNERASLNRFQQQSDIIGQLEAVYNEPSTSGISHQLSELFVSWGNLASNPESATSKTMVIRQSETFLDTVNHALNKMDELTNETVSLVQKEVLDFNELSKQLKSVNDQIFNATVKGERPNDLLDKQDQIIGDMKNIAGVDVQTNDKYGRKFVSIDGQKIVSENNVKELVMAKETVDGVEQYTGAVMVEGEKLDLTTGSIKGIQEAKDVVMLKQEELNGFLNDLTTAINTIQGTPTGTIDGETAGVDFFVLNESGQYKVNSALLENPSALVTGKSLGNTVSGDGSRAKAVANLQQVSLGQNSTYDAERMSYINDSTGSTLFNQFNEIVTDMGITKQQADNMVSNQTDLTALLEQRQASISGVDINEEIVNMIQFQSAFQANSRVISTIAEMLDTLINRTGV